MLKCPACGGRKTTIALVDGPTRRGLLEIDCSTCEGVGSITIEHRDRIEAGRKRREERIARGVSLREEARRLGILPSDLSAMESGRKHDEG